MLISRLLLLVLEKAERISLLQWSLTIPENDSSNY